MYSAEARRALPFSDLEKHYQEAPYIYTNGTVPLKEKDAEYVFYQTWSDGRVPQKNVDLVWIHGLNDYGGRLTDAIDVWLAAGFRVVTPDLPAHGRSDGNHALIRDLWSLPRSIKAVVNYITEYDNPSPEPLKDSRKVFVGGGSLGGWTALEYGLNPTQNTAGIISWCPMIYSVGESTPNILVQYVARILIRFGFGWLPLAPANRGKASTPENEAKFMNDPQTYHGNMRIATGLQLLAGMYHIRDVIGSFKQPILLCHGKKDRVIEWQGSEEFYAFSASLDRELALYDDMQHDLLREPKVEVVLGKTRDWILERI